MSLKIVKVNGMNGVVTSIDVDTNNIVYEFRGREVPDPTRTSVQIGDKHIEDDIISYVNHSCTPSVRVEDMSYNDWNMFGTHALISTRVIVEGEEVTFDYNSTENNIVYPFECSCHGIMIRGKNYE